MIQNLQRKFRSLPEANCFFIGHVQLLREIRSQLFKVIATREMEFCSKVDWLKNIFSILVQSLQWTGPKDAH